MNRIILFAFIISSFLSYGQRDTIVSYLDEKKNNFVTKDKAHYTRFVIQKETSWQVLLYNSNKKLISDELFSNPKLNREIGAHKFFYPNGKLKMLKTYSDKGDFHGNFISFYEDGGKKDGRGL